MLHCRSFVLLRRKKLFATTEDFETSSARNKFSSSTICCMSSQSNCLIRGTEEAAKGLFVTFPYKELKNDVKLFLV